MNSIKLNQIRDGGTVKIELYNSETYFIDGRLNENGKVDTHGRMFYDYPGDEYAVQLSAKKELEVYDRIIPNLSEDLKIIAHQLNTFIKNRRELKEDKK